MNKSLYFILPAIVIAITSFYSCNQKSPETEKTAKTDSVTTDSLVRLGGYLVTITGCNDCHSPKNFGPKGPQLDTARLLSGYPSDRSVPEFPTKTVIEGFVVVTGDMTCAMVPSAFYKFMPTLRESTKYHEQYLSVSSTTIS